MSSLSVKNLSFSTEEQHKLPLCLERLSTHPPSTKILHSVSFDARSSEILGIAGPSGAGKSTMLRVLSGRLRSSEFEPGTISLSGHPITKPSQLRKICGYVTQEDNLLPLLTVKETLLFSARLRLHGYSDKQQEERVATLMKAFGLTHIADSYIGDEETRGISGGEKKRVSIAVEVLEDPPILLLDEPTSGLDSTSASVVVELLASLAETRQKIIILTFHQPGYKLLEYIPTFLLLSDGFVSYFGTLSSLEDTIRLLGFEIPDHVNPIEVAMEIMKLLKDSYRVNIHPSQNAWPVYYSMEEGRIEVGVPIWSRKREGFLVHRANEIAHLCWRFGLTIYRTKQLLLARTLQAIVGGVGLGSVYLKVKKDENGVSERLGLFAFSLSFLLSSTVEALPIFLQERRVLLKEVSRGAYRVSSYLVANAIVFGPFLLLVAFLFSFPVYWMVGLNPSTTAFLFFVLVVWLIVSMASSLVLFLSALSSDFISGNSLICLVLGAFFLFSGYFIPKESIPGYWIFMYYLSMYKYPLDSLLINEYSGLRRDCFSWNVGETRICMLRGSDVLRQRGLQDDSMWVNVLIMVVFFLFYRILCWIFLKRMASRSML